MKESERLKIEAGKEDNDNIAFGILGKAIREERAENFEDKWLKKMQVQTDIILRARGCYTFNSKYGIIDFYPKANKLLIREKNQWKKPGLKFIVSNILK